MGTPPVFIVVCSNTSVSKLVYDWIAGWEKQLDDGTTVIVPGNLPLFSNVSGGQFLHRPISLLVDSAQLDRGDALDPAFRKAAAREIEEYKREYAARFPGRTDDDITDEDILREVMNSVGKRGKLGEEVRCVVSVSMLTEGWDANTVTHILGVRAFGTQLLCEQVVGRALRRASYDPEPNGLFAPEYAEIYGVPFSFLSGGTGTPQPPKPVLEVRALLERSDLRIEFPRVQGYRYEMPTEHLEASFDASSILVLSTREVPTSTELDPIVGQVAIHELPLRDVRMNTVAYSLAKRTLDNWFRDEEEGTRPWLFPQLARISRTWIDECVSPYLKDNAFPQMLLLTQYSHAAAERLYRAIVTGTRGEKRLVPILRPFEAIGSTDDVWFTTTRAVYTPVKSHPNFVVLDSSWEETLAETLEGMPEVQSYVKNHALNFKIPYAFEGRSANYIPDYVIRMSDAESTGVDDLLTLVLEVSGEAKKEKQAKVATARDLWVPAVNNWGGLGRWAFIEITDPATAASVLRARYLTPDKSTTKVTRG